MDYALYKLMFVEWYLHGACNIFLVDSYVITFKTKLLCDQCDTQQ